MFAYLFSHVKVIRIERKLAIRYRCINCNIVLSGEGASRHYLAYPSHKLEKLPPPIKSVRNTDMQ
jgi:hypothetical protein